jgi:hypothetical protein
LPMHQCARSYGAGRVPHTQGPPEPTTPWPPPPDGAAPASAKYFSCGKRRPLAPRQSPKTVADARPDSATHWHAAANAVNSATLLDTDPRYPYPPKTTRPNGSMAHTPKPANVAVLADPLLRAAPSNHTFTAVSQFPCNIPPIYPIRDGKGIVGTAECYLPSYM